MRDARHGVAQAGRVADADEALNAAVRVLVGAEAVVTALDGRDILVHQVALRSVDVEAVVVEVSGRDVAHDMPRAGDALDDATAAGRIVDVRACQGLTS